MVRERAQGGVVERGMKGNKAPRDWIFRWLHEGSKLRAVRDVNLAVPLIDAAPETPPHYRVPLALDREICENVPEDANRFSNDYTNELRGKLVDGTRGKRPSRRSNAMKYRMLLRGSPLRVEQLIDFISLDELKRRTTVRVK